MGKLKDWKKLSEVEWVNKDSSRIVIFRVSKMWHLRFFVKKYHYIGENNDIERIFKTKSQAIKRAQAIMGMY